MQFSLFYASHCSSCRRVRPLLRRLAASQREKVVLRELDVLEHVDEAVSAGVLRTPALVIDGRVRLTGAITEADLNGLLRELKLTEST
jgi:thiol-disulfide isomerase/thioredoxin